MAYAEGGTSGASNGGAGGAGGGPNGGAGGAGGTSLSTTGSTGGAGGTGSGGGGGGGGYEGYQTSGKTGGGGLGSPFKFTGGAGGNGGAGGAESTGGGGKSKPTTGEGGYGGDGGDGVLASNRTSVTSGSTETGGDGGTGGASGGGLATGGAGGTGGAGLDAPVTAEAVRNGIIAPNKHIYGSATGGNGGNGGSGGLGAGGGYGGAGIAFTATGAGASLANLGAATGGNGGAAGGSSLASRGGAGGAGVLFAGTAATLTNYTEGTITGGNGGSGGIIAPGAGGAGVDFAASGGMLSNSGKIHGGGGVLAGGAGVTGQGMTIVNIGTIAGGAGSSSGTSADAITFLGGSNTLAFNASAQFTGDLDIQEAGTTLTFDQSAGNNLPADVTLADTIDGAGAVIKADTGVLTLSTTNTYTGGTTIEAGTLVAAHVGSGSAIDALGTGAVTFAGGALAIDTSSTATLSNALVVGTGGGTLDGDAAANGGASATEVTGAISGSGALTFTDGTFTLTGKNNLFDGAANISGTGTVLANGANALSLEAAYTLSGGARLGIVVPSGATTTSQAIGSLAGTGAVSAYGDSGDSVSLSVGGNDSSTTYSGVITDATAPLGESSGATFALVKNGKGTLTLTGANTYSGGTTIDTGTVSVAADANLGATSGGLSIDGGTLETTTGFASARTVAIGSANGTVQVDAGTTTLSGVVSGVGLLAKTGAGTLTLTGANSYTGGTAINAGTLSVASDGSLGGGLYFAGGTLETTATLTSQRTVRLNGAGTIEVDSGTTTFSNTVSGLGALTKTGAGTLALSGNNTFSGGTTIDAGTLDLEASRSGGGPGNAITFGPQASPATLALETNAQPGSGNNFNTLDDFGGSDTLDLKNFVGTITSDANGVLTLTGTRAGQTQATTESYKFAGTSTPTAFTTKSDGAGGTDVIVCFASGTRIRTARGDVQVERLAVGDLAVTASGAARPIRWLGHRTLDCRRHPYASGIMPVRIAANAIAENRPARDLLVSPGHAICLDAAGEVLVPAGALVNGATITQDDVDTVTYWHVELDSHDILLAENLACESYIDCGNRAFFAQAAVVALDAVPDAPAATPANYCRPFHREGEIVAAARAKLRARAEERGWRLAAGDALGDVHLVVDGARIEAARRGLSVCFALPAGARDVRLMSSAARPRDVGKGADRRWLGLGVAAISLNDGFDVLDVALDDPRLRDGFYRVERADSATWRWTNGRARLPADLWADRAGPMLLRIDLHARALPRWLAPAREREAGELPSTRLS